MLPFIALFVTVAVLVLFLGSRQRSNNSSYGLAATALLVLLAVASTFFTRGTVFFPAAALVFAILVLTHRLVVLRFSSDDGEPGPPSSFIRKEPLLAHETWIIAALTAGLVSGFRL